MFQSLLDRLNNNVESDVNAESICALRCSLVDFLNDIEHLLSDINRSDKEGIAKEDYDELRNIIKMAGELYLNLR